MLILAYDCVRAPNDKQQITPMLDPLKSLPRQIGMVPGTPITLAADTCHFSEANVQACETARIAPLIASRRESRSGWLSRRLAPPSVLPDDPTALQKMRYRLATPECEAAYGLRKRTVELTFGIIKQVVRFRQFLVRGLKNVKAEWGLLCLAFNMKQMAVLG